MPLPTLSSRLPGPACQGGATGRPADRRDHSPRPPLCRFHPGRQRTPTASQYRDARTNNGIRAAARCGHDRPGGRRLPDRRGAGARRHGGRLQSPAEGAQADRGSEDGPGRSGGRPGPAAAFPLGGRGPGAPVPSQHRPDLRGRRLQGPAVLLAGVCRGRHSGPQTGSQAATAPRSGRSHRNPGPGRPRRPLRRHHPPRPQARQRPALGRRHAQDHRLWPGQTGLPRRPRRPPAAVLDAQRHHPGHAGLHGSRAGSGPGQGDRPDLGRLLAGGHPLRVPHRRPALPRRRGDGRPAPGCQR